MNGLEIAGLCLAVLVGAPAARFVVHEVRHWKHAKHVIRVTEEEDGLDFYGSLSLADEVAWKRRELAHDLGVMFLPAPSADPVPWLELAADGRLDEWDDATLASLRDDSGPGDLSSLAPGPDPDDAIERACESDRKAVAIEMGWLRGPEQPHEKPAGTESAGSGHLASHREDVQGRDVRVCATDSRPAARADLTGSLSSRPYEEDPGSLARGEPGPSALFIVNTALAWGPSSLSEPSRLADTGDIRDAALLADTTTYMRDQDADVADWLAGRAITWARLEIGAFT